MSFIRFVLELVPYNLCIMRNVVVLWAQMSRICSCHDVLEMVPYSRDRFGKPR